MKPIQSTLVVLATLSGGFFSCAHAQSTFGDVPDNHWAASAVKRLAEAGIIEGFPAAPAPAAKIAIAPAKPTVKVAAKSHKKSMAKFNGKARVSSAPRPR